MIRDIIDCPIIIRFYPPTGYEHYKPLRLERLHGYTHHQEQSHVKPDEKQLSKTCMNLPNCMMCFDTIAREKVMRGNTLHIPTNTHIRLYYTNKDHAFLHLYHTTIYNPMIKNKYVFP